MSNPPNTDPDLTDVPGGRWLAWFSLVALAVLLTNLLTAPGILVTITGFITVFVLPIILIYSTVRVSVLLPRAIEWVQRHDVTARRIVAEHFTVEEVE